MLVASSLKQDKSFSIAAVLCAENIPTHLGYFFCNQTSKIFLNLKLTVKWLKHPVAVNQI